MTNRVRTKLHELTPDEHRVIDLKETETPFTGEYENFYQEGIYVCRKCGLPLFSSKAKFDAKCGWPSFDDSYPYAVKELLDADGDRTEILCARCGGHLGHVFRGEQLTNKNTRHCANSLSIKFVPAADQDDYLQKEENRLSPKEVILGGGCFWCIEAAFMRMPGVLDAISGYAGGETESPSYEDVSTGKTGHAEVVKVIYDAKTLTLDDVLELFFTIHDPTSLNKQGNDVGTQYRSVVFYSSEQEKQLIEDFIAKKNLLFEGKVVTEIKPFKHFYKAEDYHQRYYEKNPYAGYCQMVIRPKIEKVDRLVG